jgi:eukaryotic-like serine/threonine-protein kinase
VVGTLEYMSPEQAQGQPVDARTDIFSLGVVLYEMLTGIRPFRGQSQPSILHEICFGAPAPPEQLRSEIPLELAALVRRCLAKSPEARYPSAAKLETALRDLEKELDLAGTASDDRTSTRIRPAVERASGESAPSRARLRPAVALLAVSALGLAGYGVVYYWAGRRAPGETPAAAADSPDSGVTPYALYNDGRTYLARSDQKGSVDRAIVLFERAVERDENYAPAYAGLAAAYRDKYVWTSRDGIWLEQAAAAARRAVELDPHLAVAHAELGLALAEKGESDEARTALEEALRLAPQNADAELGLGVIARASGRTSEAEGHFRKAIAARPDDWKIHSTFGELLFEEARYQEAQASYERVLELTPDNFSGWESLAAALHMQGRSADAAAALQRALEIQPDANTYSNLGTLLYFEARYLEAAAAFERAVELRPNQYLFWANLGDAYRWVPGSEKRARDAFRRAIQLARQRLETNPSDRSPRARLAEFLAKVGDTGAALQALAELETEPNKSPDMWFVITKAYELCGERDKALDALSEALSAGYSVEEVKSEPELIELREDVRYHRLVLRWDAEGK